MNRLALSVAAVALTLGSAGAAAAQDSGWTWTPNVAVTSDYVFRGVSQTEENPAIQGGLDVTNGQVYAGVWASNVSFPGDPDTNAEIDLYGGVKPTVGDWTLDLGVIAYTYANQPSGADYDYVEAKLGASRSSGPWTYGGSVYVSPDFFGAAEDEAVYVQGDLAYKVNDRVTVSGALGRQSVSSNFDYTTWNLGGTFALTDKLALDLRYHDTDQHDFGSIYQGRAVASLKAVF